MALSPLIQEHLRELLRLEESAVTRLIAPYRQAQAELTQRLLLLEAQGSGDTFTAVRLALMQQQVEAVMAALTAQQAGSLRESVAAVLERGATQGRDEIADLEARLGDSRVAELITAIQPVIPAEATAAIASAPNLLITKFTGEVQVVVARTLAQSVLQGESTAQAARRLNQAMGGERWKAERIARTEINQAMNVGHHAVIDQVAQTFPEMGLKKQWSAHLDLRTSRRCRGLHLTIEDSGGLFRARDGWQGLHPPAHPNCRSRVVAYSPRWEASSPQRIREQEVDTPRNPERLSRPTRADRASAQRSNQVLQPRPLRQPAPPPGVVPVPPAATPAPEGVPPWVAAVKARLAQGVNTEAEVREVGSLVRAAVMPAVAAQLKPLKAEMVKAVWQEDRDYGAEARLAAKMMRTRRDTVVEQLRQVRPMGGVPVAVAKGSKAAQVQHVQDAVQALPTAWIEASNQRGVIAVSKAVRGSYNDGTKRLKVSSEGVMAESVALHEMGHRMEATLPAIARIEAEFYKRRTAGESLAWIGPGYRKTEKTRTDQFSHPYIGKDYGGYYHEVLTMGLEGVFYGQHNLHKDPEMMDLILGMLVAL